MKPRQAGARQTATEKEDHFTGACFRKDWHKWRSSLNMRKSTMRQNANDFIAGLIGNSLTLQQIQAAQQRVADRLNARRRVSAGGTALQLGDYYYGNQRITHLRNLGYSDLSIGGHAGVRGTSEFLAIDPNGVRDELLEDTRQRDFISVGVDGASNLASVGLGRHLLCLKISADTRQISKARGY